MSWDKKQLWYEWQFLNQYFTWFSWRLTCNMLIFREGPMGPLGARRTSERGQGPSQLIFWSYEYLTTITNLVAKNGPVGQNGLRPHEKRIKTLHITILLSRLNLSDLVQTPHRNHSWFVPISQTYSCKSVTVYMLLLAGWAILPVPRHGCHDPYIYYVA